MKPRAGAPAYHDGDASGRGFLGGYDGAKRASAAASMALKRGWSRTGSRSGSFRTQLRTSSGVRSDRFRPSGEFQRAASRTSHARASAVKACPFLVLPKARHRGPFGLSTPANRRSIGERPKDLHLDGAVDETFLLATLAIGGEVRRVAMKLERRVVRVHLVEQEQLGFLGAPVKTIDETARLGIPHDRGLLRKKRRQRIGFALGRAQPCNYGEYVGHRHEAPSGEYGVSGRRDAPLPSYEPSCETASRISVPFACLAMVTPHSVLPFFAETINISALLEVLWIFQPRLASSAL